jgi:hypothetical protein
MVTTRGPLAVQMMVVAPKTGDPPAPPAPPDPASAAEAISA